MITTGCDGCCFLKADPKGVSGCVLGKLCMVKDDHIVAPGYCRCCRSSRWAKKHGTSDIKELFDEVSKELKLKFDMFVIFDESKNTIKDLQRTLDSDWYSGYASKVIIADVTGFGKRKNLALKYLNSKKHKISTLIDSSVEHETPEQLEDTVRRLSKKTTTSLFFVIPAGRIINNMENLVVVLEKIPSRVIHWGFPFAVGASALIQYDLGYGLFATIPYMSLTKSPEAESFTNQLHKEEKEMKMGLTWLCSDCCMI